MFRPSVRLPVLTALIALGALAFASPAGAQYYNQGFNSGISNSTTSAPALGSGYEGANAFAPAPTVPSGPVAAPAPRAGQEASTAFNGRRAHVTINTPEDAVVWFDGVKAKHEGAEHRFRTARLAPNRQVRYTVRARWTDENGKQVERSKTVRVRSGQNAVVDFAEE